MRRSMIMTFEKYNASDGLSQDEYRDFLQLLENVGDLHQSENVTLISYLRRIIEAKDRQIGELYEEIYQNAFKKKKSKTK